MAVELQGQHGLSQDKIELLKAPLDASLIKHRPGGGGRMLKYISGDTAIDAANRVFGFGQWGYKVLARSHEVIEDEKKGRIEFYTADIELLVAGASFPFPGDGVGIVNAPFTVEMHEKARKEAATDALKRALRHYGDQFGLCLYNEDDYVAAANGELVQVKEVTPSNNKQVPKRIVEAGAAPKQLPPATTSAPSEDALQLRLNAIYNKMVKSGLLPKGATAADCLAQCSMILGVKVTAMGQLTPSRLETIEKHLAKKQDAA